MPKIFGRVLSKKKIEDNGIVRRLDLIIEEDTDNQYCIQVRKSHFPQVLDIEINNYVQVEYKSQCSENGKRTFNNNILQNLIKVR